jgi:hypothetical protein
MNRSRLVLVFLISGGCTMGGYGDQPGLTGERPDPTEDFPRPPDLEGGLVPEAWPAPPPISGGSLAMLGDRAIVGDPDTSAIFIVSVETGTLLHRIAAPPRSEPGRIAIDGAGRAHVALRASGEILSVDVARGIELGRRWVCAAPRGIAWRESDDRMVVACADGMLTIYPAGGGSATSIHIEDDLRDIVIAGDRMLVSRFRSAEVLTLDSVGHVLETRTPPAVRNESFLFGRMGPLDPDPDLAMRFEPSVAWRMIPYGEGALLLHQRSTAGTLGTEPSGYGFGDSCASVVNAALAYVPPSGPIDQVSGILAGPVLPVDVAVVPNDVRYDTGGGAVLAIASPGTAISHRGPAGESFSMERGADVFRFSTTALRPFDALAPVGCDTSFGEMHGSIEGGQTVAIALAEGRGLVTFARAPSRLVLPSSRGAIELRLSAIETEHRGHEFFHSMTSAGLACASCHPEGGDDGRVWSFAGIGPRRTQTMRGGILGTEPFHWDGDMANFETLLEHVFAGRMSGPFLDEPNREVFARWMDALPALPRPVENPDGVARGRALFESAEVGCAVCHSGPQLTNNLSVDVGTGLTLQVPTLIGIAHRAPYMHDGCAPTLHARLTDPYCGGGDLHGKTSHLTPTQIGDLVMYLRTL